MAPRIIHGKFKLTEISEERVHQLALALKQDAGQIMDQAISEFYAKKREAVEAHKKRLEEGLVFEVKPNAEKTEEFKEIDFSQKTANSDIHN